MAVLSPSVLEVSGLTRTYRSGSHDITVLSDVSFSIAEGEICAVVGPSGSGKTTLLGLSAALDRPTHGRVRLCGTEVGPLSEDQRSELRSRCVGFVFQTFQLLSTLTALENVVVPAELRGGSDALERARDLLQRVGLGDRMHHYPAQLSGGEQQRVALARAFVNQPRILFADEPTGNLDPSVANEILDLFVQIHREGTAVLMATHHHSFLKRFPSRVLYCINGTVRDVQKEQVMKRMLD